MNLFIKIVFPIYIFFAWLSSNFSREGAIAFTLFSISLGYWLINYSEKIRKREERKRQIERDKQRSAQLEQQRREERKRQTERDKQRSAQLEQQRREELRWKDALMRKREEERRKLIHKFGEYGASKIRNKEIWINAPLEAVIASWGEPGARTAGGKQLRLRYGIPRGGSRAKNWVVLKKVYGRYVVTDFNSETRY